jgi:hypothetical protein
MPGILTATAAVLTALGGLFAALHQAGLVGHTDKQDSVSAQYSNQTTPPSQAETPAVASIKTAESLPAPNATEARPGQFSVSFPSGVEVTLRNNRGEGTYKILAAKVERRSPQQLNLKFSIRLTNKGPADLGFWSDSFRLLIDDVPRSPTSRLNDLVDAQSAKEAEVVFDLPADARKIVLKVINGQEGELPVVLTRSN